MRRYVIDHHVLMNVLLRLLCLAVILGSSHSLAYGAEGPIPLPGDALERTKKAASQVPAVRMEFVQTKHLEMLDEPLVTHGILEIDRVGGRMRWQFEHGATLILTAGKLRRWGADQHEENLGNDPSAQAMVGQMQGVLSGDWKVLGELFVLKSDAQQIEGMPRNADLARYVERMVIAVAGDGSPQKIELFTHGGDHTVYVFSAPDTTWVPQNARFSGP